MVFDAYSHDFFFMCLQNIFEIGFLSYNKKMITKKNLLGTNVITQIAIIVKDIETTSKKYAELFGVKVPKWSITDPREKTHAEYKGEPTDARAKLAFFRFKNITLELIEPVDGPSTWKEFLDTKGEGVHHIAFKVKNTAEKVERLGELGMELAQKGDFTGGNYAYVDSMDSLKVIIELLG